jgi:hypothetical protein
MEMPLHKRVCLCVCVCGIAPVAVRSHDCTCSRYSAGTSARSIRIVVRGGEAKDAQHFMSRFRLSDMESLLLDLEEELRAVAQAGEAGVQEVGRLRAELAQEVVAIQKVQTSHRSRVVLDTGGVRHVTSVSTLRNRTGSMLDLVVLQQYAA